MLTFEKYVDDVINKRIDVCEKTYLAVKRFSDDLERQNDENFEYIFDYQKAEKIINFIQSLKFSEDNFNNKPFVLEGWQAFTIVNLFAWINKKNKNRRYQKAFIFIARGNGKTPLAAAIALVSMLIDNAAQVYSISTNYSQSALVYNNMKNFINKDKDLRKIFTIYARSIENKLTNSFYRPLSKSFAGFDGFNPSIVIADEISAMKDYNLLNVMTTALHKRQNSLLFMITTANFYNNQSPAVIEYDYSNKILYNILQDDNYFALVYEIDKHDDWKNEKCYIKANPSSFVNFEKLKKMKDEALHKREAEVAFITKNLNKWVVGDINEFVNPAIINNIKENYETYKDKINDELLQNSVCFLGADFSARNDLTAITIAFYLKEINKIYLKHLAYVPKKVTGNRTAEEKQFLINMLRQGWLKEAGDTEYIDERIVVDDILELIKKYKIKTMYYDAYNSINYIQILEKYINCVAVPQTIAVISPHVQNFERELLENNIICENPLFFWCLSNARKYTSGSLVKVEKESKDSSKRIDLVISAILATIGIENYKMQNIKQQIITKDNNNNNNNIKEELNTLKSIYNLF